MSVGVGKRVKYTRYTYNHIMNGLGLHKNISVPYNFGYIKIYLYYMYTTWFGIKIYQYYVSK